MIFNKDPRNDIDDFLESTNKGGKGKWVNSSSEAGILTLLQSSKKS